MTEPSRTPAAAALGVAPGADPATARAAFLKLVAAADFVPSEQALAAVTRLGGADVPLSADADVAFTAYEQADVDAFVTQYWALPPADRQAGWEALERRCRDGDVRRTLSRLKGGLGVVVVEHPDADVNDLARFVREIYLLPPA